MSKFFQQNKSLVLAVILTAVSLFFWSFFYFLPSLRTMTGHYNIPPSNEIISNFILKLLALIFAIYILFSFFVLKYKKFQLSLKTIIIFGLIFVIVLLFIFPIISSDVLNYPIYTRIFSKYNENPYLNAPQNFSFDPYYKNYINHNFENLTMPYGPLWLSLSVLPAMIGGENLSLTYTLFKLIAALFNLGCVILIYKIVERIKPELKSTVALLYLFNPFVLLQTVVDAHNDIIMTFFVLLAIYLLQKKKYFYSIMFLVASVLVKFVSIFLLPLFIIYLWPRISKKTWLKIFLGAVVLGFVFSLAYGCLNLNVWQNILARGKIFVLPSTSIITFLFYKIAGVMSNSDSIILTRYILVASFFSLFLISIFYKIKKIPAVTLLINRSILLYIIYLLLASFLFYEWYALWFLPLLLLVPNRRNIFAFIGLSILGFLAIFIDFVNISLWALFVWFLFFAGQTLIKNKKLALFRHS